jgi:hypothetical protein
MVQGQPGVPITVMGISVICTLINQEQEITMRLFLITCKDCGNLSCEAGCLFSLLTVSGTVNNHWKIVKW